MLRGCVTIIQAEIALPHELEPFAVFSVFRHSTLSQRSFQFAMIQNLQAVGIEAVQEILVGTVRIWICKEVGIHSYFGIHSRLAVDPMDGCTFHFVAVSRVAALAVRLVLA